MTTWQENFSEVHRLKIVAAAQKSLFEEYGKKALDYLINQRHFSENIIKMFNIGYCPIEIQHQLKGRIICPIYDCFNNLIAVSSRHLFKDKKESGYFWHESFDKGSYLYALNWAKTNIIQSKKAVIVEGEWDVAAMHTYGFNMTVGVCGSTFTLSQASLLARYCQEIYIMFDSDEAGRKGVERILKMFKNHYLSSYNLKYIPVSLPIGKDPNKILIEEGREGILKILKIAKEEYKTWSKK